MIAYLSWKQHLKYIMVHLICECKRKRQREADKEKDRDSSNRYNSISRKQHLKYTMDWDAL